MSLDGWEQPRSRCLFRRWEPPRSRVQCTLRRTRRPGLIPSRSGSAVNPLMACGTSWSARSSAWCGPALQRTTPTSSTGGEAGSSAPGAELRGGWWRSSTARRGAFARQRGSVQRLGTTRTGLATTRAARTASPSAEGGGAGAGQRGVGAAEEAAWVGAEEAAEVGARCVDKRELC